MSKGPNDRSGVFFEGGFGVYGGDDTFWNNVTDNGVSAMRFERSGATIFDIQNFGELKLTSVTGATGSALEVNALTAQATSATQGVGALTVRDSEGSDLLLTVNKAVIGSGWATELRVRDIGSPTNDDVGLRLVHDIRSASPPQSAKLLSVGYTNDSNAYQEQFYCSQSGDVVLAGTAVDLLWANGGNIGTSSTNKPTNIYAATSVNSAGSVLKINAVDLGPAAATDKTITALQAATSPYIKYVSGSSKWRFSNNGTVELDFGTSNVASWDDIYDLDADGLTIDTLNKPFTLTQTSTQGNTLYITRNLSSASTDSPLVYIFNDGGGSNDDQPGLVVRSDLVSDSNYSVLFNSNNADTFKFRKDGIVELQGVDNPGIISANLKLTSGDSTSVVIGKSTRTNTIQNWTSTGFYINNSSNKVGNFDTYNTRFRFEATNQSYLVVGGALDITPTGTLTVTCSTADMSTSAGNFKITAAASYDISFTATNNAASDILFNAHNSGDIPFNGTAAGQTVLNASLPQNVVGAINSAYLGAGVTWDAVYANDKTLDINSTALTFTQTSTSGLGFNINRALGEASTSAPIVQISTAPAAGYDDQPALSVINTNQGGAVLGPKALDVTISSKAAVSSGSLYGARVILDPHASDAGGVTYYGLSAVGSATGASAKYGLHANKDWTYGIYSEAPVVSLLAGVTGSGKTAGSFGITTDGSLTGTANAAYALVTDAAGDAGHVNGLLVSYTKDGASGNSSYGVYVQSSSFDYGVYSVQRIAVDKSAIASGTQYGMQVVLATSASSAALLRPFYAGMTFGAGSTGTAYAYQAQIVSGSTSGAKYGFYCSSTTFDYGIYSLSKGYVSAATDVAGATPAMWIQGNSAALGIAESSVVTTSKIIGHASDNAASTRTALKLTSDGTGSAIHYGLYTDGSLAYGFYLNNDRGFITLDNDTTYPSFQASSTGSSPLGAFSNRTAAKVSVEGNASDSGSASLAGLHVVSNNLGSAPRTAILIDSNFGTVPLSSFALYANSGKFYGTHNFGSITTASAAYYHSTIKTQGTPDPATGSNSISSLYIDASPTGNSNLNGIYYGTLTAYNGSGELTKIGSAIVAGTGGDWGVGLYVSGATTGISISNATTGLNVGDVGANSVYVTNGSVRANSTSSSYTPASNSGHVLSEFTSSGLTPGVYTEYYIGCRAYYARNASDNSNAAPILYYASASTAGTGSAGVRGFVATTSTDVAVLADGYYSLFRRQNISQFNATGTPVLWAVNQNTTNVQAAIRAQSVNTGTSGKCLELDHGYNGGGSEDTRRAIVFSSAKSNLRIINVVVGQPHNSGISTGADYYYVCNSTSHYWRTAGTDNGKFIDFPLFIPHNAVLQEVRLIQYGGGGAATGVNLPYILVYRKQSSQTSTITATLVQQYATTTGNEGIAATSIGTTIDNVNNSYGVRYRNVNTGATGTSFVYNLRIGYDITDFAAACGW